MLISNWGIALLCHQPPGVGLFFDFVNVDAVACEFVGEAALFDFDGSVFTDDFEGSGLGKGRFEIEHGYGGVVIHGGGEDVCFALVLFGHEIDAYFEVYTIDGDDVFEGWTVEYGSEAGDLFVD